ncbi:MAG: endo-1,4-beta-xylanase [Lentisphaeria bacterium]
MFKQFKVASFKPYFLLAALFVFSFAVSADEAGGWRELLKNPAFDEAGSGTANWSLRSAGYGSFKVIDAEEGESGNILQANVTQTSAKPWSMELLQELDSDMEHGSVLHISFEYKITPNYSFHFYWQVQASPWPKLLSLKFTEPVDSWKSVQVAVPIHEDYFAKKTAFSFHLAEALGQLELRNLSAKLYPPGHDPEKLQTNVSPVLGGDFYDKDWRALVLQKIECNRKGLLQLSLQKEGKALPRVKVALRQKSSSFSLGVEASAALLSPNILKRRELSQLQAQIAPFFGLLPDYRKISLGNPLFEHISFYDGMLWRDYETWGRAVLPALLKQCQAAGKTLRGHALFTPAYMFAPPKCRGLSRDKLWEQLMKHIETMCRQFSAELQAWEVLHGAIEYNEIYNFIGVESIPEAFKLARKNAPGRQLLLSDLNSLGEISEVPLNDLIELLEWLKAEEVEIDALVLGVNLKRLDVAPQSMEKRLERLASKSSLPVYIRDFAVNEENPDIQADMLRDYLLLFFSRRELRGVSLGELWETALVNANMAYYDKKMQPKKAMLAIQKLMQEDWQSNLELESDENGELETSLFLGRYDLEARHDGQLWKQELEIADPDLAVKITLVLDAK